MLPGKLLRNSVAVSVGSPGKA